MSSPSSQIRLGVWAGDENNYHFLEPILQALPDRYRVRKFTWSPEVPEEILARQINQVDIAWFEWGTGPIIPASRAKRSIPVICRIHRYEVYTQLPRRIGWRNVDCLVLISDHIKQTLRELHSWIPETRIEVVPNAISVENYHFDPYRQKNFNLGFLGRLHYVKNPMLLIHIFKKIVEADSRYQLHIAGEELHVEVSQYIVYQAQQLGIDRNIHVYGKLGADDVRSFLSQCSTILSTSVIEGHPVGIMEAMATGCKPVIHDFPGARALFDADFLFNSIDQAVDLVLKAPYEPKRYRRYIMERYNLPDQVRRVTGILDDLIAKEYPQKEAVGF
jgi:glycosyltransferase involved in cell wall biosynthesis